MTPIGRQLILRATAIYLGTASVLGFLLLDVRGIYFDAGPLSRVLNDVPHAAIGMVEAHGLAFILAVTFWRAPAVRFWHLAAMAATALLGTANLVFWQLFVDTDALAVGYLATSLHWIFAAAQLPAAVTAPNEASRDARTGRDASRATARAAIS
jgi:hypothetical protein